MSIHSGTEQYLAVNCVYWAKNRVAADWMLLGVEEEEARRYARYWIMPDRVKVAQAKTGQASHETPELGTIVHGRDIGKTPEEDRFKWVECYNAEHLKGCRERRWASYKGPTLMGSSFRLCRDCNRDVSRRYIRIFPANAQ